MFMGKFKRGVVVAAVGSVMLLAAGCGSTSQSSAGVGRAATVKKSSYKAQDAQLTRSSNNIPVYSTPDSATRAMRRAPDETVNNGNGQVTQYYDSEQNGNRERLKLNYQNGRLVGKQIVPADGQGGDPTTVNTSNRVNVQGLTDPNQQPAPNSYGTSNYYTNQNNSDTLRNGSSSDRQNARVNDSFNQQLQRRY